MDNTSPIHGRLRKAPESFLRADAVRVVQAEAGAGRRDFIRSAFAVAAAGAATTPVRGQPGDPNILNLPEHIRQTN